MNRLVVRFLLLLGIWLCQVNATAQNPPTLLTPDHSTTTPLAITPLVETEIENEREIVIRQAPDAIMVDPQGRPIGPLTGDWSITIIDDLLRLLRQDPQDVVPTFTIQNVFATGRIIDHFVEVDAQIELLTSSNQPVRVPLGFREGILPSADLTDKLPFRYSGPGSAELTIAEVTTDGQEGQYVAIVVPQAEQPDETTVQQRHTISLVLWFPLTHNGNGDHRLSLSFPPSVLSQFLLEIPKTDITHSVTGGIVLGAREDAERQSTTLQIQRLRPDAEISWAKRVVEVVDDHPVLRVDNAIINVRLDANATDYHAILPVSSETGSFDQLQVRLPLGSVLDRERTNVHATANNYYVGDVNEESIVTIQFEQRITGVVLIQLWSSRQIEGSADHFQRELSGFEVFGAERQTGELNVSIFPPEMRPHWEPVRSVRRIGVITPSTTGGVTPTPLLTASTTRFEFMSQPFQLNVRVALPQTRINVRPEYQFRIRRGVVEMRARLEYTVTGSQTEVLRVHLSDSHWDWQIMSNIVDDAGVVLDPSGLMTIPLTSPGNGTFEIELRASRIIPLGDEQLHRITVPIPRPQDVAWSESAPVIIAMDDNVEVLPIDESSSVVSDQRTTGLTRQTRRIMLQMQAQMRPELVELQQEQLFYRTEPGDATFVADVIFRRQQINVTMQTDAHPLNTHNQVTQIVNYHAAFAPISRVYFLVPRTLEASGDIQVRWGTQVLPLQHTITGLWEGIPEHLVRKVVVLPEPMFQVSLTFQYSLTPLSIVADDAALFSLTFIQPEVPVADHRVHFFMPPGYRVELQRGESQQLWESYRDFRLPSAVVAETFRSLQSPSRIALVISASERNVAGTTIVERAWLRTWLTGSLREDQATYTVRTTADSVMIQLPPGAAADNPVFVRVDQQRIAQPSISQGMLTIPIPPEQRNRPLEIYVDYRFTFDMPNIGVPIRLPSFAGGATVQYQYWQIILSQGKHIIGYPTGWALEYDWTWNGLFWWRTPSIQRSDLGFAADTEAVERALVGTSQYVFTHLQPPSYVRLYIIDRSYIILFSSSIALLIGLVLIYVPQSRYAGSLLGLGIALLAILSYQPPLVLLMLQAATFGVFLALGAGYLYRIFNRPNQWIPPTFQPIDEMTLPYSTPLPISQTIHEVVMDPTSIDNETPIVNNGKP